jgi:pSer/pThr/pTyr-binding forkhead associated (FHA) protein
MMVIELENKPRSMSQFRITDSIPFMQKIRIRLEENGEEFEINAIRKLLIGRNDRDAVVDINLVPYGAYRLGVSRRHAQLELKQGRWFLTDIESQNGTKMNNLEIYPLVAYEIPSGTRLQFGELALTIYFE